MKRSDSIVLGVLSLVLIISFFLDKYVVDLVRPLPEYDSFISFLVSLELAGVFIALMLVYFYKTNKKIVLPLIISTVVSVILSVIIKLIIARPRFFMAKFYPFGIPDYSFPSSHAAVSFAIIPLLFASTKKLRWAWLAYAVLIAASRLLLKQHYLSDVIAGAMLGYGVCVLVVYLIKKK